MPDAQRILHRFLQAQDRLVTQSADLSLGSIASMVAGGAIDIEPEYQRRHRWTQEKQSALIESFLLNIPVPPVYLAESRAGRYSVVDGKQRISAIYRFMAGDLELKALESFHELEGLRFADIPEDLQNALKIRPYVRVVTLLKQSDPNLKYEVFTRLNRGGESMEPQELRNVMFRGKLNDLVFALGGNGFLRSQLKIVSDDSSAFRRMQDAEYVLRFLTLREVWRTFSGNFVREMDTFMARHLDANDMQLRVMERGFTLAIQRCESLWGDHAFRRPVGLGWRDQTLAGMFDAQMVATSLLSEEEMAALSSRQADVLTATRELFGEPTFDIAVREGTNTPSRVRLRIEMVHHTLRGLAR